MTNGVDDRFFAWLPDWALALFLVSIAIVAALAAHRLLERLAVAFWASHHPVFGSLLRRTRGVRRYAVVLFALSLVMPLLPLDPVTTATANRVFIAAVVLFIGWIVLVAANASADYYVGRFQIGVPDDLMARKAVTQIEVLKRIMDGLIIVIAVGFALMSFDSVRQLGLSLFASAGVVGIVAGVALRSVLANFFAGLQIALTQPIRLNDVIIVEGEYGLVEELSSAYVVIRIWDQRRLIVPLSYFIEKPFQNWTRSSAEMLGTVFVHVDYMIDVERIRERGRQIVETSRFWDRRVFNVQVTDSRESTLELRLLASATDSGRLWDLRCELREKIIAFIKSEYPGALPRRRLEAYVETPEIRLQDMAHSAGRGTRQSNSGAEATIRRDG
jgi:small-conductance mechanosensitive channel